MINQSISDTTKGHLVYFKILCSLRPHEVGSSLSKYLLLESIDLYTANQGPFSKIGLVAKSSGATYIIQ